MDMCSSQGSAVVQCVCRCLCASVGRLRSHAGCVLQEWQLSDKGMKEKCLYVMVCGSVLAVSLWSRGSGVNVH